VILSLIFQHLWTKMPKRAVVPVEVLTRASHAQNQNKTVNEQILTKSLTKSVAFPWLNSKIWGELRQNTKQKSVMHEQE
jgi:hypothetical protein